MNEKNYLIQFEYGGKEYQIHELTHWNLSKGNIGDKFWMMEEIKEYLRKNNLSNSVIKNARLFGKGGELIVMVEDFSKI